MRSRGAALAGSAIWFLIAPGTLAGLLPWALTGWHFGQDFGNWAAPVTIGLLLVVIGIGGLIESFGQFALKGLATPAPITPTNRLIVSGAYRHVRNPMYLSVLAIVTGQALLFGQAKLLIYVGILWLIFHLFVVLHEEPTMRSRFALEYSNYARAVARWIPQLKPWNGGSQTG